MPLFDWLKRKVLPTSGRTQAEKVPCARCGAMILRATAQRTGGLCLPCARPKVRPAMQEIERQPSATLSLAQYRALVAGMPLPSQRQKENFVEYVSHAHSWYKHLPRYTPGVPFYFFIDKYAGCDRVLRDGTLALVERSEPGFHYSAVPTEHYRTRFGYLAFSCGAGTTVLLMGRGPVAVPRDKIAAVPGDDALMYCLPREILEAGVAHLTAVIHILSAAYDFWDELGRISPEMIDWPPESGGRAALERIFDRCRKMREPTFKREQMEIDESLFESHPDSAMHLAMVDPVLNELLEPERQRQGTEILKAIDRVCGVIEAPKDPDPIRLDV